MNVLQEIKDHLRDEDAAEVCEKLGITSADLVERFDDYIEDNIEELEYLIIHDEFDTEEDE